RVHGRDDADPEADLPDPDEPLDHLGLRRLHAAVPADRPDAHQHLERADGHLPVRGGLREDRLRPRRRDLDPDAADRRGALDRLWPRDGAHGRRGGVKARRRRIRFAWDALGLLIFVVLAFPTFWMHSSAVTQAYVYN